MVCLPGGKVAAATAVERKEKREKSLLIFPAVLRGEEINSKITNHRSHKCNLGLDKSKVALMRSVVYNLGIDFICMMGWVYQMWQTEGPFCRLLLEK